MVNDIISFANKNKIKVDILVNEGCVPFCPNKKDHNVFTTLAHFSDQSECIANMKQICNTAFEKDPSSILRSPFLTREALANYDARLFKICERTLPPNIIDEILAYYVFGNPIDLGMVFSVRKLTTGITTDMLPASFHEKIQTCGNNCQDCSACRNLYEKIKKKNANK